MAADTRTATTRSPSEGQRSAGAFHSASPSPPAGMLSRAIPPAHVQPSKPLWRHRRWRGAVRRTIRNQGLRGDRRERGVGDPYEASLRALLNHDGAGSGGLPAVSRTQKEKDRASVPPRMMDPPWSQRLYPRISRRCTSSVSCAGHPIARSSRIRSLVPIRFGHGVKAGVTKARVHEPRINRI